MKKVFFIFVVLFLTCPSVWSAPQPLSIRYEFAGNEPHSFFCDLLGNGQPQEISLMRLNSKNPEGTRITVNAVGQETLFRLDVIGGYIGQSAWYITHLRGREEPELIYFFVDGAGRYLNDLKIIGTTEEGIIDILFDINNVPLDHLYLGANCTLEVAAHNELLLRSNTGCMSIYWHENKFSYKTICSCPLDLTKEVFQTR